MSVKHVKAYFARVEQDYLDMKQALADMEQELADKMVSPEQLEQMKSIIAPIKQNFETLSYYMYLLSQPNKEERQRRYQEKNQNLVDQAGARTSEDVLEEDQKALEELTIFKEELINE